MKKRVLSLLVAASILGTSVSFPSFAGANQGAPERPTKLADILGSTHASGRYYFTDKDFLNEGADKLLELGTRVIKLWFNNRPQESYPYNSAWPANLTSMTEVAKTPYYQKVFSKPFTSFILEAGEAQKVNFKDGFSKEEATAVEKEFYDVTKYFLTNYKNTGKTFVLQNWEGDNALVIDKIPEAERDTALKGMADWLNARQDGITKAREEVGTEGVQVVGVCEMNKVPAGGETFSGQTVVDYVVPNTHMDLYSLSTWGARLPSNVDSLVVKLQYIADKAPDSKIYGAKNVMLGEFGAYESTYEKAAYTYPELGSDTGLQQLYFNRRQLEQALEFGVVYALYWELYCNGLKDSAKLEPGQKATNDMLKGVWLIRPDGTYTPSWDYFKKILAEDAIVYHDGVKVKINGCETYFDQPPVIVSERTLVPMRKIFEVLGANVAWDGATRTVTATRDGINISLTIDDKKVIKNGTASEIDVAPTIVNGRTMVPIRFVSEAMGADVNWLGEIKTVDITSKTIPTPTATSGNFNYKK